MPRAKQQDSPALVQEVAAAAPAEGNGLAPKRSSRKAGSVPAEVEPATTNKAVAGQLEPANADKCPPAKLAEAGRAPAKRKGKAEPTDDGLKGSRREDAGAKASRARDNKPKGASPEQGVPGEVVVEDLAGGAVVVAELASKSGPGKSGPTGESAGVEAKVKQARTTKPATARPAPAGEGLSGAFLGRQRELLLAERSNYTRQAEELRAQAEALALEHEPGDVQFDEEGGEGGTVNVDREMDLHLSAQALAAIEEIDTALARISAGSYGFCESCGNLIPEARLEALPHARLCVSCKSGGLSARRQ
jgi:DnaK suppressor protein